MRRIQEKIKDLVDVRPYHSLSNYLSNPNETLQAYHFTSATSELMAKWLDYITDVQPQNGNARALAGYRGVGKSHFLATLGAIAANPDLRSRVGDQHVTSSAQRLKRRKHPVAFVQRGTAETLLVEFRNAVALALETVPTNLPETPREILTLAAEFAGEVPFVVLIDTAEGRDSRVSRDDGMMLGELADISKALNVFIAIALDDDIAGADGVNAAISRSYSIDYLDQEHLYRVVDAYLFPKQRQRQAVFHEIYAGYREAIPSFKWSEQRFSSLYPLHPIVLEIAPFVRLFAIDFVLLGFASEAVGKNLGRPANSLITLDEVFDRIEPELRKSELLKDSFETFDKITADVIGKIPILQRMQAKMILKALMILSLDSNGATASEISAAMLIYDEAEPQKAINSIEATLFEFASSLPDDVHVQSEPGKENRYSLKNNNKDTLIDSLTELALQIDDSAIQKTLRRTARTIFSDWIINDDAETVGNDSSECSLLWRGGNRRGKLTWEWGKLAEDLPGNVGSQPEHLDWEVIIKEPNSGFTPQSIENEIVPTVIWSPAELTKDECETIKRYIVLQSDSTLADTFGDQIRTAAHAHSALVKTIWKRVFLEDGFLLIDGTKRGFRKDNHEFESLHEMFSTMLSPLFDSRYPQHPIFEKSISMNTVSVLVNELFSEKTQQSDVLNRLANDFAFPLGLVAYENGNYVLADKEAIAELPWSKEISSLLKSNETIPMKQVYRALKKSPIGLIREAQHLVLAAFAGNQELEFVTSTNNRIDKRSLDLKIIWDDIVGIAKPVVVKKDTAELTNWAKVLTGNDALVSIDVDSEKIKTDLKSWLDSFRQTRVLERFEELPDNILNTKVWKLSARVGSTFKLVEDAIDGIFTKEVPLEASLQRIAEIFGHSQNEFFGSTNDLIELEDFILGASQYEEIWNYLALTEITIDPRIEELRGKLLEVIENYQFNFHDDLGNNWKEFRELYAAQYVKKHDVVMRSHNLLETIEQIYQSNEWWEFSNLAKIPIFHSGNWRTAQKLRKKAMSLSCGYDVRALLVQKPFCSCNYRINETTTWEGIADAIVSEMNEGRKNYRIVLHHLSKILSPILSDYAARETEPEFSQAARELNRILSEGNEIPVLDNTSLRVLSSVLGSLPSNSICDVKSLGTSELSNREQIRTSYNNWINSFPGEQVAVRLQ